MPSCTIFTHTQISRGPDKEYDRNVSKLKVSVAAICFEFVDHFLLFMNGVECLSIGILNQMGYLKN